MKIISKNNQVIAKWSGGTTTELFLFPPEASYANRDFLFRISTASVETETSTFTALPNYNRILMVLNGELDIMHSDQYTKHLASFEMDTFDGSWQTTAKGKVTDFNIMFKGDTKAKLTAFKIDSNTPFTFGTTSFQFGYVVSGTALVNDKTSISASDFIIFERNETITLQPESDSIWLQIEISNKAS